jgi:hypothetical protein
VLPTTAPAIAAVALHAHRRIMYTGGKVIRCSRMCQLLHAIVRMAWCWVFGQRARHHQHSSTHLKAPAVGPVLPLPLAPQPPPAASLHGALLTVMKACSSTVGMPSGTHAGLAHTNAALTRPALRPTAGGLAALAANGLRQVDVVSGARAAAAAAAAARPAGGAGMPPWARGLLALPRALLDDASAWLPLVPSTAEQGATGANCTRPRLELAGAAMLRGCAAAKGDGRRAPAAAGAAALPLLVLAAALPAAGMLADACRGGTPLLQVTPAGGASAPCAALLPAAAVGAGLPGRAATGCAAAVTRAAAPAALLAGGAPSRVPAAAVGRGACWCSAGDAGGGAVPALLPPASWLAAALNAGSGAAANGERSRQGPVAALALKLEAAVPGACAGVSACLLSVAAGVPAAAAGGGAAAGGARVGVAGSAAGDDLRAGVAAAVAAVAAAAKGDTIMGHEAGADEQDGGGQGSCELTLLSQLALLLTLGVASTLRMPSLPLVLLLLPAPVVVASLPLRPPVHVPQVLCPADSSAPPWLARASPPTAAVAALLLRMLCSAARAAATAAAGVANGSGVSREWLFTIDCSWRLPLPSPPSSSSSEPPPPPPRLPRLLLPLMPASERQDEKLPPLLPPLWRPPPSPSPPPPLALVTLSPACCCPPWPVVASPGAVEWPLAGAPPAMAASCSGSQPQPRMGFA